MSIFSRRTSVQSLLGVDSHSQGMATPGTGNRRMSAPPSTASVAEAAASTVFTPGPVSSSEAASNHEVYYVRGRPFIAPMAATNRQQQRRPSSLATLGASSSDGLSAEEQLQHIERNELRLRRASIMNEDEQRTARRRGSLLVSTTERRRSVAVMEAAAAQGNGHRRRSVAVMEAAAAQGNGHQQQQQQQQQHAHDRRRSVAVVEGAPPAAIIAGAKGMRTSLASASKIAEEEWAALFRNNLLRSCWKPGLSADEVQLVLTLWERKLVEAMHRWLHPEIWSSFRVWNHRTWPRALILQVRRRKIMRHVRPTLVRWRSISRIRSLNPFLRGRVLLPRLRRWRHTAGFQRRRNYASMYFAFHRLRTGIAQRTGAHVYLRSLRHHTVKRAYNTWLAVWVERQAAEETAIATLRSWLHGGLRRALNTFKSLRLEAEQRRLTILRWSQHSIYRLWRRWAGGFLKRQQRLKASLKRWSMQSFSAALNTWRARAAARRQALHVLVRGVSGFVHSKQLAAFNSWVSHADHRRESTRRMRSALQALMGGSIRRAWNSWHSNSSLAARLAAIVQKLSPRGRAMSKAFNTWSEKSVEGLRSLMLLNRAMLGLTSRLLWGFNAWVSALEPNEALIKRALGHLTRRSESAALNTWVAYVDARFEILAELKLALGAFTSVTFRRAMNSWLEYVHLVEISRRAASAMVDGGLLKGFNTWHAYAAQAEHAQAILGSAVAAMRNRESKKALVTWQDYADARGEMLRALGKALYRFTNRKQVAAFNTWDGYAAERRRYRAVVTGFLMYNEKEAVRRWRAAIARAERRLDRLLRRAKAALTGPGVRAFNKWHAVADNGAKLRKAVVSLTRRRERIAFNTWVEEFASSLEARSRAAAALKKLGPEGRALTKALNSWLAFYAERTLMRSSLFKLVHGNLVRAFGSWRDLTVAYTTALRRMRRAAARFTLISIVKCINTWRARAEEVAEARERLGEQLYRWRNGKITASFNTWVGFALDVEAKRRALAHLTNRGLSIAWRSWEAFVDERLEAMESLRASLATFRSLTLRRAFNSMASLVEDWVRATAAPRRALTYWRSVEIARCLNSWENFMHDQRMIRRAASALFNKRVNSAFNSWCAYVEAHAESSAKLATTLRKFSPDGRAMTKALNAWVERHEEMRLLRRAASALIQGAFVRALRKWDAVRAVGVQLRTAIRRMQSVSLVRAIHQWRARPAPVTPAKRAISRLANQALARAFTTWEAWLAQRQGIRQAMGHLAHRSLSMAWRSWEDYLETQEIMAMAVSALVNSALRRATNTWARWVEERMEARDKIAASLSAMTSGLRAAFNTWSTRIDEFDNATRALRHLASRNLSVGWNTWVSFVEDQERLRCALAHLTGRGMVKAFGSWEAYVEDRRRMRKAVSRLFFRAVGAAMTTWVDYIEDRLNHLEELRSVAAAFRGPQKKAMNTWCEYAEQRRTQHDALYRLVNQSQVRALNAWVEYVEVRAAQRERMRAALTALSSGLRAVLNTWIDYAIDRQHAILALGSFVDQSRRRAFNTWADQAAARAESLEVMRLAVRQLFAVETRRALNSWLSFLDEREQMRAAVSRMVHASLSRAMRSWEEFLEMMDVKHRTLSYLLHRGLARGFRGWCSMLEDREFMASILNRMINHSMRRALARWAQSAEEREEKMRVMRGTLYSLAGGHRCRMALNSWTDYLEGRMRAYRAVSAFVNGSSLRAWNRWVAQVDERHAALERMHSALMIGERKAFNTWHESYEFVRFAKRAFRYWKSANVASAFRTWTVYVADRLSALRRSAGYMFYHSTARALRSWVDAAARRKAMQRAVFVFTHQGLRKAINSWISFTSFRSERMRRVRGGFVAMLHAEVRRAMNSWKLAMTHILPIRRAMAFWLNAPQAKALFKLRLYAFKCERLRIHLFRLANQRLSKAMNSWRARYKGKRKFGKVGAAWYHRPQRIALNSWIFFYRGKRRLRGLIMSWKGARRSFNKWKSVTRRRPLVELGAPVNLRSIRAMTWRECCAWLHSVGIHVSRSPPTLLRTLRAGAPYQELVRRISVTFWMRHKMSAIANPISLFTTLQHFFETEHVIHIVGCQRLDVGALESGKAIEHLELLASMREILIETQEMRAIDAVARNGIMLGDEL